jgi:hypothetical protein
MLFAVMSCVSHPDAQTGPQTLSFQISSAQAWTDTGLDLQPGDVVDLSATANPATSGTSCNPAGTSPSAGSTSDLPLPTAPVGALIARLHDHGATPVLVGAGSKLRITGPSHLSLGINRAGSPPCQGSIAVTVTKSSDEGTAGASAKTADAPQPTRKEQLRSQLSAAAQIFMAGQFGASKSDAGTNSDTANASSSGDAAGATAAPPTLKLSDAALDADLRKSLDSLPRRVNDQFQNLGDMVNFAIIGSQKDVQAALDAATWHVADVSNQGAVLAAVVATYDKKDYLAMPMSTLYLFGRKQDFGYELAEPIAMVASRHHFRIWKAPFTWNGQEVWVGAGTHDIGFAKDRRNGSVTHKIDPSVDGERDNIGASLQKANKAKTLTYYLPPDPIQDAKNATGDVYHSDGKLLVITLQ